MTITKSSSLEEKVKKIALDEGAVLVGICSADSIKEKIFSAVLREEIYNLLKI